MVTGQATGRVGPGHRLASASHAAAAAAAARSAGPGQPRIHAAGRLGVTPSLVSFTAWRDSKGNTHRWLRTCLLRCCCTEGRQGGGRGRQDGQGMQAAQRPATSVDDSAATRLRLLWPMKSCEDRQSELFGKMRRRCSLCDDCERRRQRAGGGSNSGAQRRTPGPCGSARRGGRAAHRADPTTQRRAERR